MIEFKKEIIEDLFEAAKNTYPREFLALLGSTQKNNFVDEFVVIPASYGKELVHFELGKIPIDKTILGSVHSHPTPNNRPSRADLSTFKKTGKIHLIIAYPFNLDSCALYDTNGKEINWVVK